MATSDRKEDLCQRGCRKGEHDYVGSTLFHSSVIWCFVHRALWQQSWTHTFPGACWGLSVSNSNLEGGLTDCNPSISFTLLFRPSVSSRGGNRGRRFAQLVYGATPTHQAHTYTAKISYHTACAAGTPYDHKRNHLCRVPYAVPSSHYHNNSAGYSRGLGGRTRTKGGC